MTNSSRIGARVLVVDDEPNMVAAYVRALRSAGFEVETATDGRMAVEKLQQVTFDVVLSDIAMPQMDGIKLLRAVRQQDMDLPVVLATGAPSLDSARHALEHGAFRYLCKPVKADELVAVITQAAMLIRLARLKREAVQHLGQADLAAGDRAGLEVSFERALNGLWIAYQPIIRHSTRSTFGYEALLRSTDPTLRQPAALLDAAERLGRLHDLGRMVRKHVAMTVGPADIGDVFINVHPHDLIDEDLYLADAPLSRIASRVVLEITERASLEDIADVPGRVQRLRALGYRVAVDDIGAGYAGLTSVANLQPEVMKIDMALVRGIDLDPIKQKLVRAMVLLCDDMNVLVIAEGIESAAEYATLTDLGCDLLQGYWFAKPDKPFVTATYGSQT